MRSANGFKPSDSANKVDDCRERLLTILASYEKRRTHCRVQCHHRSDPRIAQAQRVADHGHRRQAHCGGGDHRTQEHTEERIQHAGRYRHAECVVAECERQVLVDVANRRCRQFIHKRSIKNDDIKKTSYGHINLYYHAEGDISKSEVLVNMSSTDRAKLLAIYIDGLLRAIRDLDDRVLAAKKFAGKKMNNALNMGVRIR